MKQSKKLTINGEQYILAKKPNGDNSNYNHSLTLRKVGDKMPLFGLSIKETEDVSEYAEWAERHANSILKGEDELTKTLIL